MSDINNMIINSLNRIEKKVDSIEAVMITADDCKTNQKLCINSSKLKKMEITPKNITALTGIVALITTLIIKVTNMIFGS